MKYNWVVMTRTITMHHHDHDETYQNLSSRRSKNCFADHNKQNQSGKLVVDIQEICSLTKMTPKYHQCTQVHELVATANAVRIP